MLTKFIQIFNKGALYLSLYTLFIFIRCRYWPLKTLLFILTLFLSLSTLAKAELEIAYTNFPPFIWQQAGEAKGIYVDVLKEALENRMQIPLHFQALPYKRILGQLQNANIDGIVDVATPELLALTKHGKVPVAVGMVGAFTHKNAPKLPALNSLDNLVELKNYRLLSYQNDDWGHHNLRGMDVDYGAKDIPAALQKLVKNRGDIFLQIEQVAHHYIDQLGLKDEVIQIPNVAITPFFYQLNLSKESTYVGILPDLDTTLTMMLNDGTIDAIYKRYHFQHPSNHYFANKHKSLTIKLIHYWTGALQSGMSELTQRFNDAQSHYQLKTIAMEHEPFKQAIKLMIFGDSRADIYSNWAGARTQFLVDTGNLVPLDDIWQQANLEQRFSNVVKQACTYNQKKYAIPVTQHLAVFFYNKHIFKKYGLKPPRSWSDFLTLGDKLIKHGITPVALGSKQKWPAQFWFDYLLLRTAGPKYRERLMRGEVSYTDKQVKQVYILWKQLIDKGFFNKHPNQVTWTQAAKQIHEEKAAMTLMGTWLTRYFESEFKWQENGDYGFFVFPRLKSNIPNVAVGPIDLMVQVKGSDDDSTKKAMLFFAELESQKTFSKVAGSLAPNIKVPVDSYSPMKQELLKITQSTSHWAFNYDLATPPAVSEIGLSSFAQFLDHPDQYQTILKQTQKAVDQYYTTARASLKLSK